MTTVMTRALGALVLAVSLPATAQVAAIEVLPSPPGSDHRFAGFKLSAPFPREVTMDPEADAWLPTQVVRLTKSPGHDIEARVQVQFETSLTVMAEGPHLDLLDWKHCASEWRDAPRLSPLEFRIPEPSEAESTCFPSVTPAEIKAAVRKADAEWAEIVRDVKGPHDYPLGVSISTIRIRVQVKRDGAWSNVMVVSVPIPMGC